MTLKASTGLRNKLLDTGPLKTVLLSGFIKIYAGPEPSDADAAIGGGNTLLCTISVNSTGIGLSFDAAATGGNLAKNPAEVWSGNNVAGGTATFYRFVTAADTGVLSTTEPRLQGSIGLAAADMILSNVVLTNGAPQAVDYYVVALPVSA